MQQDVRDDFDADLDAHQEVIMSVNVTDQGSVGCAFYVAQEEKLSVMEDIQLGGPDMVDARKWRRLSAMGTAFSDMSAVKPTLRESHLGKLFEAVPTMDK